MPYYGKLPNYFDLWLTAVQHNSTIDFCLITDLVKDKVSLPKNVKVIDITFDDFYERIQRKFDFNISITNYGRISQFRPAMAYIFPEVVEHYDYWGFIECDLIPGDIRNFITDEVLENNEKVFKLGHFQIFKNTEKMNTLFMYKTKKALSYKFAFQNNIYYFEELLGMHNIAVDSGVNTYTENVFADVVTNEFRFYKSKYGYRDLKDDEERIFEYDCGKLYDCTIGDSSISNKKEILYAHLQKRSMEVLTDNYEHYLIVPNKFVSYQPVDKDFLNIIREHEKQNEQSYKVEIQKRYKKDKSVRYHQLCWWKLLLIRKLIKFNGGVDLDGA